MAKLVFHVQAEYEEVIKLRNEIEKLKKELKGMDAMQSPATFNTLNAQLSVSTKKMDELVTEAAKVGAAMEIDFKRKIFDASQVVNGLSEKITLQRGTIQQLKKELSGLKDKYREALKQDSNTSELETKIKEVSAKLRGQKEALFNLTQEQANARLSVKKLRDEYELFNDDSKGVVAATEGIGISLKKAFAVIGGASLGKQFISDMIRVRGEFQAADTAIQTLLGSKEKADALMSQVREYAKISPLEFSDVTQATQMMLGFNIEAEKVPQFLQAIGDVSMGETQKFNSLTLAFSQMSAAGKLMGNDLNQMINAGFNPLQTMSEKTGKSIAQLKDEMSKGAISAEMVQQAFIDATSAGGKFYQMSENASETINGQLSMMQDAIDSAFNELGQASEGVIMTSISTVTKLIENYEMVGKVLAGLVTTYGLYKTAVFLVTAAENGHTIAMRLARLQILLTQKAQALLNTTMLANPYVLVATALGVFVATLIAQKTQTELVTEAEERYNEEKNKSIESERKHAEEIEKLINIAGDESLSTENRRLALVKLEQKYPDIFKKYDTEAEKLAHIRDIRKEIIALDREMSIASPQNEISEINKRIEELNHIEKTRSVKYMGTSSAGVSMYTQAGLSEKETAEREMLLKKRQQITNQIQKDKGDKYLANLTGVSNADLDKQIKERENLLAKMNLSAKKYGKVQRGGAIGIYNEDELRGQIQLLQSEKTKRTKKTTETKQSLTEKKKDLQAQFDALSEEEAIGKKGLELKKKIAEYDERLRRAYSISGGSSSKESNKYKERLEAEKKANEDLLKLKQANKQAQIDIEEDTTDKKLKVIDLSYDKQKTEIAKKEREFAEQNKKAGTKGLNEKGLTEEQQAEIDQANEINDKSREKQISDAYKAELSTMRDYLKEYGTFQQQKLAIAEEYAEKIAKAQNDGERMTLEKRRDAELRTIEINALKQEIDWKGLLGDFGGLFEEQMKPTLEKLRQYAESDEFKQADIQDQQIIYDLITKLAQETSGGWGGMFKNLGDATENYRKKVIELEEATEKAKKADEEYAAAKAKAGDNSDVDENVKALGEAARNAAENQKAAQADVMSAQNEMGDAATRVRTNLNNLVSGLQQLGSGSMSGILQGANNISKLFGENNLSEKIAQGLSKTVGGAFGTALGGPLGGEIVAGVFSLLDLFKDGIENLFSSLIDTVLGSIDGLIGSMFSLDIPTAIAKSLRDGIGNITDTLVKGLSFGLADGINWSGSNAKEVAEITERLTNSNDRLRESVDNLKNQISDTGGWRAIDTADQAYKDQEKINSQTLEILKAQMGYHGSHHSNAYYWRLGAKDYESLNESLYDYAKKNNKDISTVGSLADIYKLSPEEMDYIRTYNIDMWNKMLAQGKYDKSEFWEQYADLAGELDEITESLKENLTQISFSSMRDSFISDLMDMKKDAKDFSDDFSQYLMKSMLNAKISDILDNDLQVFYDKWSEFSKSYKKIDESERDELKKMWDDITQKGIDIRNDIASFTGYDQTSARSTSQESTRGSYETISQETGEELNGRITAIHASVEGIREENVGIQQSLNILTVNVNDMLSTNMEVKNIADETRTLIANSYLELVQISENTGAIVKPIRQIQKDIEEVKKNTSRL